MCLAFCDVRDNFDICYTGFSSVVFVVVSPFVIIYTNISMQWWLQDSD